MNRAQGTPIVLLVLTLFAACLILRSTTAVAEPAIEIASPGLPPSQVDAEGRLVEDWGTVGVQIICPQAPPAAVQVRRIAMDECIPAAEAISDRGPLKVSWTVYRSPIFPSGVDVLTVRLQSQSHEPLEARVKLDVPEGVEIGLTTARRQNRVLMSVLPETLAVTKTRAWGFVNETTPMPGWARPEEPADPAYANIRAGMGGIPILYRFKVEPSSSAVVVLGICESHYDRAGIRPVLYEVEGARPEVVDPIARWGRHKPGVLVFRARDVNGDGQLEVAARPLPAAPDRNPILNVIWVFPPDRIPNAAKLIAGELSSAATYYVDVGGRQDQCFYEVEAMTFPVELGPRGSAELTFLVACPGASAPLPEATAWTVESLRRAAREVWLAWRR